MINEEKSIFLSRLAEKNELDKIKQLNSQFDLDFEIYNNEAVRRACANNCLETVYYLTNIELHGLDKAVNMRRLGNLGFDYAAENENIQIVQYLLTNKTLIAYDRHIIFSLYGTEQQFTPYTINRRSIQQYIMSGKLDTVQTILNIFPQNETDNIKYKILEGLDHCVSKQSVISAKIFKFSSYLVEKFNLTSENMYDKIDSNINLEFLEPLIVAYQERGLLNKRVNTTVEDKKIIKI